MVICGHLNRGRDHLSKKYLALITAEEGVSYKLNCYVFVCFSASDQPLDF